MKKGVIISFTVLLVIITVAVSVSNHVIYKRKSPIGEELLSSSELIEVKDASWGYSVSNYMLKSEMS
ncbi:MAG: hypothetical protein R2883_01595 [Caldisericia bacterium]